MKQVLLGIVVILLFLVIQPHPSIGLVSVTKPQQSSSTTTPSNKSAQKNRLSQFAKDWSAPIGVGVAIIVLFFQPAIRNHLKWSRLRVGDVLETTNDNGTVYYRLAIRNSRSLFNEPARYTEAYVTSLTTNNQNVANFLPAPLEWTHVRNPSTIRTIYVEQLVFLDICRWWEDTEELSSDDSRNMKLTLRAPTIEDIPMISELRPGNHEVEIAIYQQSGQTTSQHLSISWPDVETKPTVIKV